MDTIDAVLAHFCRSPSDTNAIPPAETQNSVTTTASSSRSSKDNISAHHAPAIEQMLDSAMRRVKHSQHAVGDADADKSVESVSRTQESSDTEEPLVVVDLGPVPPASVDMIPVHAISENAKIDMLLTGRKLLSE
ncbi:hypothetical protein FGIG_03942 [Fasciola gigantica]|uniref:Uncharacterized protein n=1 Tax=Fasciola gigantica TaxID=46835 RepID=A0A504YP17_FASGI|nr:hypothetical protein FGIG_03942 [Fasciola gigantica]